LGRQNDPHWRGVQRIRRGKALTIYFSQEKNKAFLRKETLTSYDSECPGSQGHSLYVLYGGIVIL
jgi:hypothetical protein